MTKISIVIPTYNEEENINNLIKRLQEVLTKIEDNYEIIFVLDPSTDKTEELIIEHTTDKRIKLIKLSRRFGQPAATMAGIKHSSGDNIVIIDADLQDPPELIIEMLDKMRNGYDVVYAKRISRDGETFVKKIISALGYRIINFFSDVYIPPDVGDFRIISKKVGIHLSSLKENSAFLRGLVSYVGFRQTSLEYKRDKRSFGKTKYNRFLGSLKIGLNGLIGFTSKPLQLMSAIGFCFSLVSFFIGLTYVIAKILGFTLTAGLPTTVLFITFFSGIQLIALGLLGEYIGRIYDEVKNRPQYIIDKKINFNED